MISVSEALGAAVAETHSAVIFFFGDRAYKVKKPVDLGFLDFSTREARQAVCHREVELNRRLAPEDDRRASVWAGAMPYSLTPPTSSWRGGAPPRRRRSRRWRRLWSMRSLT